MLWGDSRRFISAPGRFKEVRKCSGEIHKEVRKCSGEIQGGS